MVKTVTKKVVENCLCAFFVRRFTDGVLEEIEGGRNTVKEIGYEQSGFPGTNSASEEQSHGQSVDIARGVEGGNKDEVPAIRASCSVTPPARGLA
jgi:S-adenosylmethionine synthetase